MNLVQSQLTTHTKRHDSCITIPPVSIFDVFIYKWQHMWHNVIFTASRHQH